MSGDHEAGTRQDAMPTVNQTGNNPLSGDLDQILALTGHFWDEVRGRRLFMTGGTGFFGRWLLESFAWANRFLDLQASIMVLSRNPVAFRREAPHLAVDGSILLYQGDIRDFSFPEGEFSHIIHAAATSARATFNNEDQLVKFDALVSGTRRLLDFAVHAHAGKVLFTSSGAVYGRQPESMSHMPEEYSGAPYPEDVNAAWGEGKRAAEFLCSYYARRHDITVTVARCFSFVGPHLPLDIHYAVGNFIRDRLMGRGITVTGDGSAVRSYLYAADLTVWLWTILFRGKSCCPYNVGSEEGLSIAELAAEVANSHVHPLPITIAGSLESGAAPQRYVPSTRRCRDELGLKQTVPLSEALRRTCSFYSDLEAVPDCEQMRCE